MERLLGTAQIFTVDDSSCPENHFGKAAALRSAVVSFSALGRYKLAIQNLVESFAESQANPNIKELKGYLTILQSDDAFQILTLIWKESDFMSNEDCVEAGYPKVLEGQPNTQSWLARHLCDGKSDFGMINTGEAARRYVGRMMTAAEAMSLVQLDQSRKHTVPINPTALLAQLIWEVHAKNAFEAAEVFGMEEELNPLGQQK